MAMSITPVALKLALESVVDALALSVAEAPTVASTCVMGAAPEPWWAALGLTGGAPGGPDEVTGATAIRVDPHVTRGVVRGSGTTLVALIGPTVSARQSAWAAGVVGSILPTRPRVLTA